MKLIKLFFSLFIILGFGFIISYDKANASSSNFDVGYGVEWPDYYFAPFVDVTAWTSDDYSINGVLNVDTVYEETGVKYYNLGFINATLDGTDAITTTGYSGNEILYWSFGGYETISPYYDSSSSTDQYSGITSMISSLRDDGGDVTISIGGLNEGNFYQYTTDETLLKNTYLDIVNGFGLTRLDFDIEGSAQASSTDMIEANTANAKAIKEVQDETGVELSLTLPVLPTGLTSLGLATLDCYLEQGVSIDMVNIMTMCYGDATINDGETYGEASLRAMDNLKIQLQDEYASILSTDLSDDEAFKMMGSTISIGFESSSFPYYTVEWAELMYDYAIDNKVGMLSFWSLNRDTLSVSNEAITTAYEFTDAYKDYNEEMSSYNTNGQTDYFQITLGIISGVVIVFFGYLFYRSKNKKVAFRRKKKRK